MANVEKHKKNLALEWLEEKETIPPSHSRSSRVLGAYVKANKPAPKKFRPKVLQQEDSKPDVALMREPGPPPKLETKHSQYASWERQRKLERLPQLRAPYQYKSNR